MLVGPTPFTASGVDEAPRLEGVVRGEGAVKGVPRALKRGSGVGDVLEVIGGEVGSRVAREDVDELVPQDVEGDGRGGGLGDPDLARLHVCGRVGGDAAIPRHRREVDREAVVGGEGREEVVRRRRGRLRG